MHFFTPVEFKLYTNGQEISDAPQFPASEEPSQTNERDRDDEAVSKEQKECDMAPRSRVCYTKEYRTRR